jgi:predicted amidophosphoribosyltransferase
MSIAALARRGMEGLLDLVLPPRCLRCGVVVEGQGSLCAECWRSLTFLGPPQCRLCGYPLPHALPEAPLCGECASVWRMRQGSARVRSGARGASLR